MKFRRLIAFVLSLSIVLPCIPVHASAHSVDATVDVILNHCIVPLETLIVQSMKSIGNVLDATQEESFAFIRNVYEFWSELYYEELDTYFDWVAGLDRTDASSGVAVTGFTASGTSSVIGNSTYLYYFYSLRFMRSDPAKATEVLKNLGINDRVLVACIFKESPCYMVGYYFNENGALSTGLFKNPLETVDASLFGVYSLSNLDMVTSHSSNIYYSKEYGYGHPDFATSSVFYIDFSKDLFYNTGNDKISLYVYQKTADKSDFSTTNRSYSWSVSPGDIGEYVSNTTSYYYPGGTITWDNSHIVVQPTNTDESSRLSALTAALNEWNQQNTLQSGSTVVNYYISPVDSDGTYFHPGLYDEETLVYSDPVTETQYLTNGWTYDYLTRSYTLDMADDTCLIGDTVIDTIKLTYGDELLTVEYYSGGSLIQTDEYNYVMVSGSECGLNGHTYTYENVLDPTCTAPGERKYTCSVCGNEYTEAIPAVGHAHTFSILKAATCTTSGIGLYSCSSCGSEYTEEIPATEHTPQVLEVVPSEYGEDGSLISVGYTLYECTVCGTQYTVTDTVDLEEEGWFAWLGSLFKTLLSSIVNGLASGLEWIVNEVLLPVVSWIVEATKWVFGLFNGEHLSTLFNWFNFNHEAWLNEFSDPALFKEVA